MSKRKRFYRVGFLIDGKPAGTLLACEESVEMAITSAFRVVGRGFSTHSVNPVFMSDEEEHDFMHFIIQGNKIADSDKVSMIDRLKGMFEK